jgi:hypothetical protein
MADEQSPGPVHRTSELVLISRPETPAGPGTPFDPGPALPEDRNVHERACEDLPSGLERKNGWTLAEYAG